MRVVGSVFEGNIPFKNKTFFPTTTNSKNPNSVAWVSMHFSDRLPYILIMSAAVLICASIAVRAFQARRKIARAASFSMMALFGAFWMLMVLFDITANSLAWKEIWWRLIPFGILNTLMALLYFSLQYSLHLERVPPLVLWSTIGITLIITALAFTNHLHHQMWTVSLELGYPVQVMGKFFNPIGLYLSVGVGQLDIILTRSPDLFRVTAQTDGIYAGRYFDPGRGQHSRGCGWLEPPAVYR
jgi:hypothetical protein